MTTAIAQPGRSRLPILALLGAGAAAALSVVAIVTDDVSRQPIPIVSTVDGARSDAPSNDTPFVPPIVRTPAGRADRTGCLDGALHRDRQTAC